MKNITIRTASVNDANDLLDIYIQQDIFPIEKEDLSVLELPVFNKYGGFVPTVRLFGGKAKYKSIIKELIQTIYE